MKRSKVFYGWWVVVGVLVSSIGAGTMSQFGFSPFIRPMSESLGWSRGLVASGISLRLITGAVLSIVLGRLIDRHGVRRFMLVAGLVGGASVLLMSRATQPWQFLALYAIAGGVTAAAAGELMVGSVIPKWFVRRRGRALAFGTMGAVIVGVALTPITAALIARYGWQAGWLLVGTLMLITIVPVSFLMRRRPEDMGLLPDGATPGPSAAPTAVAHVVPHLETTWTPREAVRTPVFWLMVLGFNLSGLSITGVVVHEISYLMDRGYAPAVAGTVLSVHAFAGVCGRFVWGYLVDKLPVRLCLTTIYLGAATATVLLLNASSLWIAFAFAVLYGLNIGGNELLNASAWSNYYGRTMVGAIRGVVLPFQVLSMAAGPPLAGLLYGATGNYTVPLTIFIGTFTAGGLLFTVLRPPVKRAPVALQVE